MSSTKIRGAKTSAKNQRQGPRWLTWGIGIIAAVIVLAILYSVFENSANQKTSSAGTTYDVGVPGIGLSAPAFTLTGTNGRQLSLTDFRGKDVLLYFQEGLSCQPCWDQLTSLEKDTPKLQAAGIDAVLSITTDPANLIARKTQDMGLTTPVLSDPDLATSERYGANQFGMMGTSRDGHSFILVGPNGTIRWRADYGGSPNYTMFVPVDKLLRDLKAGAKP